MVNFEFFKFLLIYFNFRSYFRIRRSQVPCGIGARARTRHGSLQMIAPVDHSSSYDTETTNEDDDSEFSDRRHRSPPPPSLLRGLSMIEVSEILSEIFNIIIQFSEKAIGTFKS